MSSTSDPLPPVNGQVVSVPQAQPTEENAAVVAEAQTSRRKWKIIAAVVIMAIMFYLLYKQSRVNGRSSNSRSEGQQGADQGGPFSRLLGGIIGFDRSGDSKLARDAGPGASAGGIVPRHAGESDGMADPELEKETDASLLLLAKNLKAAGFTLMGKTQCRWTKVQREMFGDRDSAARRELESMYVECLTNDMCPGVRGYPTWTAKNRQFPGFQPPDKLRKMAEELSKQESRPMLVGAPEPLEENIPDAQHNADIPAVFTPEMARKMFYEMLKENRANNNAVDEAAIEADRSGAGVSINPTGSLGVGAKVDVVSETGDNTKLTGRKENVRGVSMYAPLNVPDMPGTAPMNLDMQHADYQSAQGNLPRTAFQNHSPMAEIAQQVIMSLNNLREQVGRNPDASTFSQTRYPHSSEITTGEGLADKRIPVIQQPGSGGTDADY